MLRPCRALSFRLRRDFGVAAAGTPGRMQDGEAAEDVVADAAGAEDDLTAGMLYTEDADVSYDD